MAGPVVVDAGTVVVVVGARGGNFVDPTVVEVTVDGDVVVDVAVDCVITVTGVSGIVLGRSYLGPTEAWRAGVTEVALARCFAGSLIASDFATPNVLAVTTPVRWTEAAVTMLGMTMAAAAPAVTTPVVIHDAIERSRSIAPPRTDLVASVSIRRMPVD